jgi:hypothetical protein
LTACLRGAFDQAVAVFQLAVADYKKISPAVLAWPDTDSCPQTLSLEIVVDI